MCGPDLRRPIWRDPAGLDRVGRWCPRSRSDQGSTPGRAIDVDMVGAEPLQRLGDGGSSPLLGRPLKPRKAPVWCRVRANFPLSSACRRSRPFSVRDQHSLWPCRRIAGIERLDEGSTRRHGWWRCLGAVGRAFHARMPMQPSRGRKTAGGLALGCRVFHDEPRWMTGPI